VRDQRGNIEAKRLCDAQCDDPDRNSECRDHGDVKQIFVCPPEVFQVAPECRLKRNSQPALESRCVVDARVKLIVRGTRRPRSGKSRPTAPLFCLANLSTDLVDNLVGKRSGPCGQSQYGHGFATLSDQFIVDGRLRMNQRGQSGPHILSEDSPLCLLI
jgi:hypothetical protein